MEDCKSGVLYLTFNESYTENETHAESYPEQYTEIVQKVTKKEVPVADPLFDDVQRQFGNVCAAVAFCVCPPAGAGIGMATNMPTKGYQTTQYLETTEDVPMQRTRMVEREVLRPVTKSREKRVAVPRKPEDYRSQAKDEILRERRKKFASKK